MDKEKVQEGKSISYDYLFNYFGGDMFKGIVVLGASVQVAIRAYKNGTEVKFKEFEMFLRERLDDFDISDNKTAQVPSVCFF